MTSLPSAQGFSNRAAQRGRGAVADRWDATRGHLESVPAAAFEQAMRRWSLRAVDNTRDQTRSTSARESRIVARAPCLERRLKDRFGDHSRGDSRWSPSLRTPGTVLRDRLATILRKPRDW